MQNITMKSYLTKLPYIGLMFILSLYASYIYYGEFRLSQLIIDLLISNLVILMPDYFCMSSMQDEFNIWESLKDNAFLYGIIVFTFIIMRHLRFMTIDTISFCVMIAFLCLFPIIVDRSRYTDRLNASI